MTQIEKLEKVVKDIEAQSMDFFNESAIARKHNYSLEATLLFEKYQILNDTARNIRMKVIEELIPV